MKGTELEKIWNELREPEEKCLNCETYIDSLYRLERLTNRLEENEGKKLHEKVNSIYKREKNFSKSYRDKNCFYCSIEKSHKKLVKLLGLDF